MKEAARVIVRDCLAVRDGETILIIVDQGTSEIGKALFEAARDVRAEAVIVEMLERTSHGAEPPKPVAEAMKTADVVIAATSKSMTYTKARLDASFNGARVASMPTITPEIMCRTMSADYTKVSERSHKLSDILSKGNYVFLSTPGGTDLTMQISGRIGVADTGMLHQRGAMGNLPAGEAFVVPIEGTAKGQIVIDISMAGVGRVSAPIKMVVEDGYVTEIIGGVEADRLSALLQGKGKEVYNLAELGIGTNDKAIASGSPLEDEKAMGTIHIAIGDNSGIGGTIKAPMHLDGVMKDPTLIIDGTTVMKDGRQVI
jgi:leucyl aminopeptidase (aminopeptidase T)